MSAPKHIAQWGTMGDFNLWSCSELPFSLCGYGQESAHKASEPECPRCHVKRPERRKADRRASSFASALAQAVAKLRKPTSGDGIFAVDRIRNDGFNQGLDALAATMQERA